MQTEPEYRTTRALEIVQAVLASQGETPSHWEIELAEAYLQGKTVSLDDVVAAYHHQTSVEQTASSVYRVGDKRGAIGVMLQLMLRHYFQPHGILWFGEHRLVSLDDVKGAANGTNIHWQDYLAEIPNRGHTLTVTSRGTHAAVDGPLLLGNEPPVAPWPQSWNRPPWPWEVAPEIRPLSNPFKPLSAEEQRLCDSLEDKWADVEMVQPDPRLYLGDLVARTTSTAWAIVIEHDGQPYQDRRLANSSDLGRILRVDTVHNVLGEARDILAAVSRINNSPD